MPSSIGNTFDLKLVSTGEDGIEEMIEDLNANKILYAFIKGNQQIIRVIMLQINYIQFTNILILIVNISIYFFE